MRTPVRGRAWLIDAGIAASLLAATLVTNWTDLFEIPPKIQTIGPAIVDWHQKSLIWWAATAVGSGTLLVRSRLPMVALVGATVMCWIHLHGGPLIVAPIDLAMPIALYSVAARVSRQWVSLAALTVPMALLLPLDALTGKAFATWGPFTPAMLLPLAWFAGDRNRIRTAYLAQVEQRAHALERERDAQALVVAAAERSRIARELHDVVAHTLSVIVVQAQAAAGSLPSKPEKATESVHAIVTLGRGALAEMRLLLGLQQSSDGESDLAPLPGLRDLPALVERLRAAGLPVGANLDGPLDDVPASVGLSAYRIAQEALTNVLKHAGPAATAQLDVYCHDHTVEVSVQDSGVGAAAAVDEQRGNGLRGMRDRVAMLGGTLSVTATGDGGVRVHAQLPRSPA